MKTLSLFIFTILLLFLISCQKNSRFEVNFEKTIANPGYSESLMLSDLFDLSKAEDFGAFYIVEGDILIPKTEERNLSTDYLVSRTKILQSEDLMLIAMVNLPTGNNTHHYLVGLIAQLGRLF